MTDRVAVARTAEQRLLCLPMAASVPLAVARGLLGLIFLVAGVGKLWNLQDFAIAVSNYRMVPESLVGATAVVLPGVEAVAGAGLLTRRLRTASAWVIMGLCAVFVVAVSAAMARGLNIECGCFSVLADRRVGLGLLIQDIVLLALACYCAIARWRAEASIHESLTTQARSRSPKTGGAG